MNTYPLCDSPLKRLVRRSFTLLQISPRKHSCMCEQRPYPIISDMVFVPVRKPSGIEWTLPEIPWKGAWCDNPKKRSASVETRVFCPYEKTVGNLIKLPNRSLVNFPITSVMFNLLFNTGNVWLGSWWSHFWRRLWASRGVSWPVLERPAPEWQRRWCFTSNGKDAFASRSF